MPHPFSVAAAETLTGTRTLTVAEVSAAHIFHFDPGGAGRNLDLPAAASCTGLVLFIANKADAAEVLTIRTLRLPRCARRRRTRARSCGAMV